jgi:hypothetical protein
VQCHLALYYFNCHALQGVGKEQLLVLIGFSQTIIWAKAQFLISIFHPRPEGRGNSGRGNSGRGNSGRGNSGRGN